MRRAADWRVDINYYKQVEACVRTKFLLIIIEWDYKNKFQFSPQDAGGTLILRKK
jgi:hypothetical protein